MPNLTKYAVIVFAHNASDDMDYVLVEKSPLDGLKTGQDDAVVALSFLEVSGDEKYTRVDFLNNFQRKYGATLLEDSLFLVSEEVCKYYFCDRKSRDFSDFCKNLQGQTMLCEISSLMPVLSDHDRPILLRAIAAKAEVDDDFSRRNFCFFASLVADTIWAGSSSAANA